MRKLILSACALFLVGAVTAQSGNNTEPAKALGTAAEVDRVIKQDLSEEIQSVAKGVAFFTEDFANGFDGNNTIGPWDAQDSGGDNPIWMVATAASPAGDFSGNSGSIQSTTAANGWVIYDSDLWNSPFIGDTQGFLTSPTVDCSARSTVLVEFEHYYRYCCFPTPPMTVGASADGGLTWTEFPAAGDVYASTNVQSGDFTTLVDISCVAANQADVKIRFSYNADFESGYSHYFWGVDDVKMYEADEDFDMRVTQVTNGDVFNEWEYRVSPISQARPAADGGLFVSTVFENTGKEDLTGVTVTVEILDAGGTVLNTTVSDPFDFLANSNSSVCPVDPDTVSVFTDWVPDNIGDYTVRSTMNADQTLSNVEDDMLTRDIVYTDCVFGHDDSPLDVQLSPRLTETGSGVYRNAGYGNRYTMTNPGSVAVGMVVRFGSNTDTEFDAEARIYTVQPTEGIGDATFLSTFYEITPADVPNTGQEISVYIPFDDEVELEAWNNGEGPSYFVAIVNDEESPNQLTVLAHDRSDSDNSSSAIDLSGNQEYVWFSGQPESAYVRLVIDQECSDITGLEEDLEELNVTLGQNVPNPATGMTTIQFTMEESLDIDFQIVDNMGRVVYTKMMGTLAPGQHRVELNAASFAPGIYQYSLISEGKRSTKSMVISK